MVVIRMAFRAARFTLDGLALWFSNFWPQAGAKVVMLRKTLLGASSRMLTLGQKPITLLDRLPEFIDVRFIACNV